MKRLLLKIFNLDQACKVQGLVPGKSFLKGLIPVLIFATLLIGCDSLRPSVQVPIGNQSAPFKAPTPLPTEAILQATETNSTQQAPQITDCTNDLVFLEDLSIPDGTQIDAGKVLEKEWQVRNIGTCNWNEGYSVRLISGPELGAAVTQALVPARNGTEAVIRIQFTAPAEPGRYTSTWRAFDPSEKPFGEWFSIEIVVTSP